MIIAQIQDRDVGELDYNPAAREHLFRYLADRLPPVSLVMPATQRVYLWKHHLHPFFEMYLPEGYLFEIFKGILTKEHGEINDFLLFSELAPNLDGRVRFRSDRKGMVFPRVDLDEILDHDTEDTFSRLLKRFLYKNAISGVQPKTLALVEDKGVLKTREYIIKTWGSEFPRLAENEYFCLRAARRAGIAIPGLHLSRNRRFLLVEKFDIATTGTSPPGFEEVLGLLGRNREQKYTGSYEQVAGIVFRAATDKLFSMNQLFRLVVMNYLLKNGDAHLKNFGILYNQELTEINISPAYDIVCTIPYLTHDRPALTLRGRKVWFGKKELLDFGEQACQLSHREAREGYEACRQSVSDTGREIREYVKENPGFADIAERMMKAWQQEN